MVVAGRIEEARAALTARYGPGLLDGAPRLDFKLKVTWVVARMLHRATGGVVLKQILPICGLCSPLIAPHGARQVADWHL